MTTYYWRGSTGYSGGWGNQGYTQDYLSGVTTGMYWNVTGNWLEHKNGYSGGCSGGQSGSGYFVSASRIPGAGDTVIIRRIRAGNAICDVDSTTGLGLGVTGDIPYSPLLFGGYYNPDLNEGGLNKWTGGGGWIGAGSGFTSGRLGNMTVYSDYFYSAGSASNGLEYKERSYPLGLLPADVTKIEQQTGSGPTFSGLQLHLGTLDILGSNVNVEVPDSQFYHGPNHCSLILSNITNAQIGHWNHFEARGCTFDILGVSRTSIPWSSGDSSNPLNPNKGQNAGRSIIGKIEATTRGNSGNASWVGFPSTISTNCSVGGQTGGDFWIKTTATIPTLSVYTNWRKRVYYVDADITTFNLYPELQRHWEQSHNKPVVITSDESSRVGVHSVTTLNMKDSNPAFGSLMYNWAYDGLRGKGRQNMLGMDCGVTFDTANIDGGLLFVGSVYGFPADSHSDNPEGCYHGGSGKFDQHGSLIKDGTLGTHAFIDHRHPTDPTWKRFKIGDSTTHPSAEEGYTITDGAATTVWGCDHYICADYAYQGATSGAAVTIGPARTK